MRKTKKLSLLFVLIFLVLCQGCSSKGQQRKEAEKQIIESFKRENIIELQMKQKQDDLSIELNHVVFEENLLILDCTMKSSKLSKYEDVFPELQIEGVGERNGISLESNNKKNRVVYYFNLENGTFSKNDIGKEVKIVFTDYYKNEESGIEMIFPVKIDQVFSSKIVDVSKEFSHESASVVVKSIEISKFRTDLYIEANTDFMKEIYAWEITDNSGTVLPCLRFSGKTYNYTALPEECREIGIILIKYGEDGSYDKIGEIIKVPID